MVTEIEELQNRVDKIEKQNNEEILSLVEILSNAAFFGEIKKSTCEFSKNGQCSYFFLEREAKNRIPIATECRIKQCEEPILHCHLEVSNLSCTFCLKTHNGLEVHSSKDLKKEKARIK